MSIGFASSSSIIRRSKVVYGSMSVIKALIRRQLADHRSLATA
jgi:hypothetical protein